MNLQLWKKCKKEHLWFRSRKNYWRKLSIITNRYRFWRRKARNRISLVTSWQGNLRKIKLPLKNMRIKNNMHRRKKVYFRTIPQRKPPTDRPLRHRLTTSATASANRTKRTAYLLFSGPAPAPAEVPSCRQSHPNSKPSGAKLTKYSKPYPPLTATDWPNPSCAMPTPRKT